MSSDPNGMDPSDISPIIKNLESPDGETRKEAIINLSKLASSNPEYVAWQKEAIRDCLDDPNPEVRSQAAELLGELGATDAREELRDLRLDPETSVSKAATEAIRAIDQTEPVSPKSPPKSPNSGETETDEQPNLSDSIIESKNSSETQGTDTNSDISATIDKGATKNEESDSVETEIREESQKPTSKQENNLGRDEVSEESTVN